MDLEWSELTILDGCVFTPLVLESDGFYGSAEEYGRAITASSNGNNSLSVKLDEFRNYWRFNMSDEWRRTNRSGPRSFVEWAVAYEVALANPYYVNEITDQITLLRPEISCDSGDDIPVYEWPSKVLECISIAAIIMGCARLLAETYKLLQIDRRVSF